MRVLTIVLIAMIIIATVGFISSAATALNLSPNPSGDEVIKCRPAKSADDVWFVVTGRDPQNLTGRPVSLTYFDLYPESTLPKEMAATTSEQRQSCSLSLSPKSGNQVHVSISPHPSKKGNYKGVMTLKDGKKENVLCRVEPKMVDKFGCLEKNMDRLPASDSAPEASDNESY